MIRSMTAFARTEVREPFGTLSCELRSVNHRFLEPGFRLPSTLADLEPQFRERLRNRLSRGKVDIALRFEAAEAQATNVAINEELAARLIKAAEDLGQYTRHVAPVSPTDILRLPGVLTVQEPDSDAVHQAALALFEQTLDAFIATREREGTELARLIQERLTGIRAEVEKVGLRIPQIQAHYRDRLLARLAEVKAELEPTRLEQELVLFAHKMDVSEELDRLLTHVAEIERVLRQGGAAGRRLDFLMQELNREANTLGSKSVAADTSQSSVELKVLIEQMREQIQNIE